MVQQDNIHFSLRTINGYNLPFNFIISEREAGKSTAIWLQSYDTWLKDGKTTLVVRRKVVHITKAYIDDICQIIRKFRDESCKFEHQFTSEHHLQEVDWYDGGTGIPLGWSHRKV